MRGGIACKLSNRNFIGIEIDEQYFNIGKAKIEGMGQIESEKPMPENEPIPEKEKTFFQYSLF